MNTWAFLRAVTGKRGAGPGAQATRQYLATLGRAEGMAMPEGALLANTLGTLGTVTTVWRDVRAYKRAALFEIQARAYPHARTHAHSCACITHARMITNLVSTRYRHGYARKHTHAHRAALLKCREVEVHHQLFPT